MKDVRRIVYGDSQLDRFKCLDWDWTDNDRTLNRLKDLWFKFIVFDTNTHTIEKDPNWSLHKKVNRFLEWANASARIVYHKPKEWISFVILP